MEFWDERKRFIMSWVLLPVNYTDAIWSGLKRYIQINNEDGSVSFQDVTNYTGKENSFFGALDANRMNEALNTIMSMVENGTDLYEAFQSYFNDQKNLFKSNSDSIYEDFVDYVNQLKADGDQTIDDIKTDYSADIEQFKMQQEALFELWFNLIKDQLGTDAAGNLLNMITAHTSDKNNPHTVTPSQIGAAAAEDVESKLDKSGGTMTGALIAGGTLDPATAQVRNILLGTTEPDPSAGNDGDIYIQYAE